MSKIVWNINQFTTEQDTPYLWVAWWFDTSLWCDIRKEPPFVKLSTEMKLERTFDDDITFMQNLEDFWLTGILVCLENWKVYLDWVLKHTFNTWTSAFNKIIWVWYMWDVNSTDTWYLYYFSNLSFNEWKIHRSTENLWTFVDSHRTFYTSGYNITQDIIPTISEPDRIIFGARDTVFEIDNLEVLTTLITFNKWEEVVWMSEFQNNYKIYNSVIWWSWFISWYQYTWDWFSNDWEYRIVYNKLPFQWIVNDRWYDYVITGHSNFYTDLYKIWWSVWEPIRVNLEGATWKRNFSKYISMRWEIIYISGKNKLDQYCIYTLGSYYPWFQDWLVWEYYINGSNNAFTNHCHWQTKSYFATANDKVYSVDFSNDLSVSNYVTQFTVITKKWVWNWIHTKKSIDYMYIGYKLEVWTSILVYASNWNWTYKLLKTIAITTETPITQKWIVIPANEFQSLDLWDFYELDFKFIWVTTDAKKTPALWECLVFCNDDYNK